MRPELKIVLVAVEIIVVIAAALALEQCGTGSENSDKGYISGEYSGGAQENIDYEAKTVAIDSGHGGIDPGKISADGILEKDVNLAIASKLKILLEQSGITVIMTRADDNGLYQESDSNKKAADMKKRCSIINGSKADIAVSIHQNSYVGEASKGAQVFYYKQSEEGKKLAGLIKELKNPILLTICCAIRRCQRLLSSVDFCLTGKKRISLTMMNTSRRLRTAYTVE